MSRFWFSASTFPFWFVEFIHMYFVVTSPFPVFVSFPAFFLCTPVFCPLSLSVSSAFPRRSSVSSVLCSLDLFTPWLHCVMQVCPWVSWYVPFFFFFFLHFSLVLFCQCWWILTAAHFLFGSSSFASRNTIYTSKTTLLHDNLTVRSVSSTCRYLPLWSWSDTSI